MLFHKDVEDSTMKNIIFTTIILIMLATNSLFGIKDNNEREKRRIGSSERELLLITGLPEDINDNKIIKLLDVNYDINHKDIFTAISLIRYRRIDAAIPKMLEIFKDKKTFFPMKRCIAEALCDFGNKEWMTEIKYLFNDPNKWIPETISEVMPIKIKIQNQRVLLPTKIELAGLMARGGDYSLFQFVANNIDDNDFGIRMFTIEQLPNFINDTSPESEKAADTLLYAASSDVNDHNRIRAIFGLDKMLKIHPDFINKLIQALENNLNSNDKYLKYICEQKLKMLSDPNRIKQNGDIDSMHTKPLKAASLNSNKSLFSRPVFYLGLGGVCLIAIGLISIQKNRKTKQSS